MPNLDLHKDNIYQNNFSPIKNVKVHLDASLLKLPHNSKVSTWNDLSGNQINLIQPTINNQPTYNKDSKSVVFNGSSNYMHSNLLLATEENKLSIFAVVNPKIIENTGTVLSVGQHYSGRSGDVFRISTEFGVRVWGGNTIFNNGIPNKKQLVSFCLKGNNIVDVVHRLNGNIQNSVSSSPQVLNLMDGITLGNELHDSSPAIAWLDGEIFEVLIYNRDLPIEELNSVESYLMSKWGVH